MQPLKILHIIWSTDMGGISKIVLHLCQEQRKDDTIHVSVFSAKGKSALFEKFEENEIQIFAGKFTSALSINASIKKDYQILFSQFDILHFHSFNPVLASIARKSGKKIVYTEHGNFGIGRKMKINDLVVRWLQKKFLNKDINAITFNSNFTKEISISRFGLNNIKKEVIYNGVPENATSDPNQNHFRKNPSEFLIASVGRLASVKRFDRLLRTLSKVGISDYKMLLMGTGPEESELKKQTKELNLEQNVTFIGQGNSIQLLKESNLCIIPSQGEAFGLVAIEAYQQGKQVLVFKDGGGVTELVNQVEPTSVAKNENELATILSKLIQQSHDDEISVNRRKNFAAQFSMTTMANKIKNLYLSL